MALKKPPPLVPSILIASCEATGPCAMVCVVTVVVLPSVPVTFCGSTSFAVSYGSKFCTTPCETSTSANTIEIGSSTHSVPRVRSTQKLPSVFDLAPRDAADERDCQRQAHGRRPEVMRRQPEHLREIAHRGLGHVDCQFVFVVNEIAVFSASAGSTPGRCCGLQRQPRCSRSTTIRQQQRRRAEDQHGDRVFGPAHLLVGLHAGQAIQQPLARHQAPDRGTSCGARRPRSCSCPSASPARSTAAMNRAICSQPLRVMLRTSPDEAGRKRGRPSAGRTAREE